MHNETVMDCDHDNEGKPDGLYGDHDPIYKADDMNVAGSDYHKFNKLYPATGPGSADRIVSFDNWKLAESLWSKRFKVTHDKPV